MQGPGPLRLCPMDTAVAVRVTEVGMGDMITWDGLDEGSGALQDTASSSVSWPPSSSGGQVSRRASWGEGQIFLLPYSPPEELHSVPTNNHSLTSGCLWAGPTVVPNPMTEQDH